MATLRGRSSVMESSPCPTSYGGVMLIEALNVMERLDIANGFTGNADIPWRLEQSRTIATGQTMGDPDS